MLLAAGRGSLVASWSYAEDDPGLISIEELTSSNSKSSAVEPYWMKSIKFWALPVGVARVGNPLDASTLIAVIALGWC